MLYTTVKVCVLFTEIIIMKPLFLLLLLLKIFKKDIINDDRLEKFVLPLH